MKAARFIRRISAVMGAFAFLGMGVTMAAQDSGFAVYYSDYFQGKPVANGEIYSHEAMTGAHNSYPFGSEVRVTNISNGKNVVVTINDRMRKNSKVAIDLSRKAAEELGFLKEGRTQVTIERVGVTGSAANADPTGKPTPIRE